MCVCSCDSGTEWKQVTGVIHSHDISQVSLFLFRGIHGDTCLSLLTCFNVKNHSNKLNLQLVHLGALKRSLCSKLTACAHDFPQWLTAQNSKDHRLTVDAGWDRSLVMIHMNPNFPANQNPGFWKWTLSAWRLSFTGVCQHANKGPHAGRDHAAIFSPRGSWTWCHNGN